MPYPLRTLQRVGYREATALLNPTSTHPISTKARRTTTPCILSAHPRTINQPTKMLNAPNIPALHDHATAHWHNPTSPIEATTPLDKLILDHHRANFDLWHTEDQARAPHVTGEAMIAIKHNIDRLNQQRNDLVERIDIALLEAVPNQPLTAPLHSETPGLMIDRLSILALKIFHTEEETRRPDAAPEHHQRNRDRLELLTAQRNDLAAALTALWAEVLAGTRRFKLYRQLKMYNDPTLNPVLYAQPTKTS